MDFENRPYRPLDMQRYHHSVNMNQLFWGLAIGIIFFGLTCVGEPFARKNKNGTPILPAATPTEKAFLR